MKIPHATPTPAGTQRAAAAKSYRDLATESARLRPHAITIENGEEEDHGSPYPAKFTKGLLHGNDGLVSVPADYRNFVCAINAPEDDRFETDVTSAAVGGVVPFQCTLNGTTPRWRGWESPRCGHVYELEGPDAGSLAMAPAPRVGSSELAAEVAEVYAMALLRDVPFTAIVAGNDKGRLCAAGGNAELSGDEAATLLNAMPFFVGNGATSSTPRAADAAGFNRFERGRRFARTQSDEAPLTAPLTSTTLFRGSTPGSLRGPYVSQFLLIGSVGRGGPGGGAPSFPGLQANHDLMDGFVNYGSLVVDQRTIAHLGCLDHMTDWWHWLDVQNGADLGGAARFEDRRRFITTPRDLATYVHYDALYEAYLNAALLLLGMGAKTAKGFPEPSPSDSDRTTGKRTPFACFGGPHILSLVTEVATRALKAVRRQKFNHHRRARPEVMGGRLTLTKAGHGARLRDARAAFEALLAELPPSLLAKVHTHNVAQNAASLANVRGITCPSNEPFADYAANNVLLPMAFPEGSPMHPAYGAGHATVAGACVTVLKAFFEMFEDSHGYVERVLRDGAGNPIALVPNANGHRLVPAPAGPPLTIQGELDKLAANIAIGRDWAGVHYYSDYYDSIRMGERLAVGILLEQAPAYGEFVEMSFTSFDGDHVVISGRRGQAGSLCVLDRAGKRVASRDWWLRHTVGEELTLDS